MIENKRDNFRLFYPNGEGPTAVVGAGIFQVVDISVTGIRIKFTGDVAKFVQAGDQKIVLKFNSGIKDDRIEVEGKYFRHSPGFLVFLLKRGVPLKKINDEQFRLKRKYASV